MSICVAVGGDRVARVRGLSVALTGGMAIVAILPAAALGIGAAMGFAVPMPGACWWAVLVLAWGASVAGLVGRVGWFTVVACLVGFVSAAALLAQRAVAEALAPAILRQSAPFRLDAVGNGNAMPVEIEADIVGDAVAMEFGAGMTVEVRRVRVPGEARDRAPPGGESADRRAEWQQSGGRVRLTVGGAQARARVGEWRAGRRIRATVLLNAPLPYRNFGTVDQEQRLALAGIRLFGTVKSAALVEVVGRGRWWEEASAAARDYVRRTVGAAVGQWDARSAAIVTAILIGDRAGLDPQTESRLQRAGTYHVIAISGGNIAILVTLVGILLRLAGASPRLRAWLAIVIVVAYAIVVGSGASVARATLGAVVYLFAQAIDHRSATINILGVAVAAIVVLAPLEIIDPAFWLTCVATLAILVCAQPLEVWLRRVLVRAWLRVRLRVRQWPSVGLVVDDEDDGQPHRWLDPPLALLAATIAAESWLLPIAAYAFSQVTFAGLVLNFAAIPLMAVAQIGGFVVLAAAALSLTPIVWAAGFVAYVAAYALVESARLVELVPQVALRVPPPPLWLVIVAEVAVIACWLPVTQTRRRRVTAIVAWTSALALIVIAPPALSRPALSGLALSGPTLHAAGAPRPCALPDLPFDARWLRLTALDVAQGDATLLRLPTGDALMVDTGGTMTGAYDLGARIVSPALWALGLRRLQILALTHGDRDHIGGAPAILHDFAPREVWEGVPVPDHVLLSALRQQAAAQGTIWTNVSAGDPPTAADANIRDAVQLRVLNPPRRASTDRPADRVRNDDSIVLEVTYGAVSIVLPGDIGPDVERHLAAVLAPAQTPTRTPTPLRILKAAHHGSGRSSTAAFLAALAPRLTIISAGRANRFGHPAPATLARYHAITAAIFRTDEDGAIEVDTNGHDVYVTTCSGRHLHLTAP